MKEDRRSFVKMAAAGAAGMVVGGGKVAYAQDGPAPLNTPITDLLGTHASNLVKDAKKLNKGDLIQLRKFHNKDPEVTKLNTRLKRLDFSEVKSIETAFDKLHNDENYPSISPSNVHVSCCCCTPCCTCAAAVIEK